MLVRTARALSSARVALTHSRALSFTPSALASHGHDHAHGHGHGAAAHDSHGEHHDHGDHDHHADPNANPHHAGYESVYARSEDFSSRFWVYLLVGTAGLLSLSRLDDYITKGGEKDHPLTVLFGRAGDRLASIEQIEAETRENSKRYIEQAKEVAVWRQIEAVPIRRLNNPQLVFEPRHGVAIPVGQDTETIKEKPTVKSQYDEEWKWQPTRPVFFNPDRHIIDIPWKLRSA